MMIAGCRAEAPGPNAQPAPEHGEEVVVDDAWARPVAARETGRMHSAAYFTLRNHTGEAVRLVRAETDVSAAAEIHETVIDENGVMRMREQEHVDVEAGGETRFEPGGLHVMLMNLDRELVAGDSLTMTLHFEDGHSLQTPVVVRPATL